MPSFNKVILMGNLCRDPELRHTGSNMAVVQIGIAVNERWKNKSTDQWEERVSFIDCEGWGRTAENISQYFGKGKPILIEGKLRMDQWEDKQTGQKRSKLKVVIDRWEFVGGRDNNDGGGGGNYGGGQRSGGSHGGNGGGYNNPSGPSHTAVDEDDIPF